MVKSTMTETCSAVLRSRRNCSSDDSAERTDDGRAVHESSRCADNRPWTMCDCEINCLNSLLHRLPRLTDNEVSSNRRHASSYGMLSAIICSARRWVFLQRCSVLLCKTGVPSRTRILHDWSDDSHSWTPLTAEPRRPTARRPRQRAPSVRHGAQLQVLHTHTHTHTHTLNGPLSRTTL